MRQRPICLPAAAKIAGCEELVLEILVRMPAKSLLRSKLVSKQWRSLISDPQFIRKHTLKNPNKTPSGLFFYDSHTGSSQSVSLNHNIVPSLGCFNPNVKFSVAQSCNGLLLLRSISPEERELFGIYNPTTLQLEMLRAPEITEKHWIAAVSLVFDPSVSVHYKVICIRRMISSEALPFQCRIDIYSSEDHSWRKLFRFLLFNEWCSNWDSGVYCNGAIYHTNWKPWAFRFDLQSETFIRFKMPEIPNTDRLQSCGYLGQCGGYVHFIKICHPSPKKFFVLELSRDCSKWVTKYEVTVSHLIRAFPEMVRTTWERGYEETTYAFSVLHVFSGATEEDSELVMSIPGKVISYNFVKKTVKALC